MYSDVKYKKHMLPLFKSYIHSISEVEVGQQLWRLKLNQIVE